MALDKSKLEIDFEKIFNVEKSPIIESESHCAELVTDAIIKYLSDVKIGALAAPGIDPAGPTPDPGFSAVAGQLMSPVVPADANQDTIKAGFKDSFSGNTSNVKNWVPADAAFIEYVTLTYAAFLVGEYIATGTTSPGAIDISVALGDESENSLDIAEKLTNQVHTFFTSCVFTGQYLLGSFVGPAPHNAPLE